MATAFAVLGCSRLDEGNPGILTPGAEPGINLYGGGVGGQDDIDDLSYLRAIGDPAHDYGTMIKTMPTRDEHTHCDRFIVFDYGMPGPGSGTFTLTSIY